MTRLTLLLWLLVLPAAASAQRTSEFCRGFEEGYKSLSGGLVPLCPLEPLTPLGSTPFREGLKAGTSAARKANARVAPMATDRENAGTFCGGFSEGYKAIKGELALVPLCPLEPLTPLGSTPFREGVKAGMAKARER